ncbi:MAG TPA: ParA family protein [Arenicellales bacterium]|nr:ParA family protein [Arenicellales bacterium]
MGARSILVINSKGGAGKSTLTSNLASFYAVRGYRTALFDFDRQMSGVRWLERRPERAAEITGVTGWTFRGFDSFDRVIMDPPAQIQNKDMAMLVARADVVIVPVLPSPIDIHAAADFIRDLLIEGKVRQSNKPVCVVANRVRTNTVMYEQLRKFLGSLKIPFVTTLRDSQNYMHASMKGIGIFEMNREVVGQDLEHWRPLIEWIDAHIKKADLRYGVHRSDPVRPPLKLVQ